MKVTLSLDAFPIQQPSLHCSTLDKNMMLTAKLTTCPPDAFLMTLSGSAFLQIKAVITEPGPWKTALFQPTILTQSDRAMVKGSWTSLQTGQ